QTRFIRLFADELGVEAEMRCLGQTGAALRESRWVGDDDFFVRIHALFHCPSQTLQPPSIGSTIPVMNFDSSLHRNTAASAQSSGLPGPGPRGCFVLRKFLMNGSFTARAAIGVSIKPGASTLILIISEA